MAEEYEVPSPHEHAVEHAVEVSHDSFAQRIALMTAVLATIGALISYVSGSAQNEAMALKNDSILKQAQASDQWAFYQSKSTKQHVDDAVAALATSPEVRVRFASERDREAREMVLIQKDAIALQSASRLLGEESAAKLRPHERMALGMTFIQIAVALAAITVLTRRRWLIWGALTAAAVGVITVLTGFL